MEFRYAKIEDIPVLTGCFNTKYINRYLNRGIIYWTLYKTGIYENHFLILKSDDISDIVGGIVLRKKNFVPVIKENWWIYNVFVKEIYKGKGYGKYLMEKAIAYLKVKEIKKIYLKVEKNNIVAINLYNKFDFNIVKEVRNDFIMKKLLNE